MEDSTTKPTSFITELSQEGIDLKRLLQRLAVIYHLADEINWAELTQDDRYRAEFAQSETEQIVRCLYQLLPDADRLKLNDEFAVLMHLICSEERRTRSHLLH